MKAEEKHITIAHTVGAHMSHGGIHSIVVLCYTEHMVGWSIYNSYNHLLLCYRKSRQDVSCTG